MVMMEFQGDVFVLGFALSLLVRTTKPMARFSNRGLGMRALACHVEEGSEPNTRGFSSMDGLK